MCVELILYESHYITSYSILDGHAIPPLNMHWTGNVKGVVKEQQSMVCLPMHEYPFAAWIFSLLPSNPSIIFLWIVNTVVTMWCMYNRYMLVNIIYWYMHVYIYAYIYIVFAGVVATPKVSYHYNCLSCHTKYGAYLSVCRSWSKLLPQLHVIWLVLVALSSPSSFTISH